MTETTSARIFNGVMSVLDLLGMKSWRARTVAPIKGTILEIGAGGGRNARWLDPGASVVALDPDFELLKLAREKSPPQVRVVVAVAEALPFKDDSFDSALATLVLCSVDDQHKVASELKRTLRPGGVLHGIDHVLGKASSVKRAQRCLGPGWHRMTGSCRIDRETLGVLRAESFDVTARDSGLGSVFVRYEARTPVTADERI